MQVVENQRIPTELTEAQFEAYVRPYIPKQLCGPPPNVPLYKIFNYILYVLYTGCQWESLKKVIDKKADGTAEIHYTNVFRRFNYWSSLGVFKQQFMGNLALLYDKDLLDLTQLNGDGTNAVAKKGAIKSGIAVTNIKKVQKTLLLQTKTVTQ
jgi:transposase